MRENFLNLPHHLRRLRFVPSQLAALAMAGEYQLTELDEVDREHFPELWLAANAYHDNMLSAIVNEGLSCKTYWRDKDSFVTRALFHPEVIWPWVMAELTDNSLWYGAQETTALGLPPAVSPPADETSHIRNGSNENILLLNAALVRLLVARSHSAYLYGKKPNISALARDAAAEVAYALPPDADKTETFRKLLSEALSLLPSDVMSLDK
jgi:hypothetical protein